MPRIVFVLLTVAVLSATTTFAQEFRKFNGEISSDNINVRADTTVSSEVICVLKSHDTVEVSAELYDWYRIRLPKNAPSFVKKSLFECLPLEPSCSSAKATKDRINVRLKPSENSQILGKVNKDEIVNVLGDANGWFQIEPIRNSFGYVNKKFVKPAQKPESKPGPELIPTPVLDLPSPDLVAITGIIQPYGRIFGRQATHKLVSLDKTYLLKGNKKSLDAINYNKVKVTGKLSGYQGKYPIIEIVSIEAVE
ncbi:MAG: SH3 domain-containing protein [Candidatus Omnitrophota bacterium]